jgi:acetyl-CoA carboxylase biotin carboxyl carrier protein
MSLSHDDVERLLKVLEASTFDELQLETEGIKLTLRRRGAAGSAASTPILFSAADQPSAAAPATAPRPAHTPPAPADAAAHTDGLLELRAPMLGSFFRSPQPGAAPFVEVGSRVSADSTVGIIEVMKLMNPVTAELAGEVVEVRVRDGELVEYGQVLMRIRPQP